MSYASVAAHNVPPPSQQPHPDPALLTTEPPSADNIADDAAKVNVVATDFRSHPETITSISGPPPLVHGTPSPAPAPRGAKGKAKQYIREAEEEGSYLVSRAKRYILRPGVAGGLVGLVNIGLVSFTGYSFYMKPHLRRDARALSSVAAATLLLLTGESYVAEQYRQIPRGQAEEAQAKKEGATLYRHAKEHVLRPGVLGGLVGFANAGILGALGYYAYTEWDQPRWDRRTLSAISVGLLTLWSGEGYLAERYRGRHQ